MELGPEPQSWFLPCRAVPGEPRAPSTNLRAPEENYPATHILHARECPLVQPSFRYCDSGQASQASKPPSLHAHEEGVEQVTS